MALGISDSNFEILETSNGNAGISRAFIGTMLGFKVTIVMPKGMRDERKKLIRAYGSNLILTPGGESDVDLCIAKAEEMMKRNPRRYFFPNQFENPDNPLAHYKTTGPEIWNQTKGEVRCFVASQGTGGTVTGVGRYLCLKFKRAKRRASPLLVYTVEPKEAPILTRGEQSSHRIEGIGNGFVPRNLDLSVIDGVVTVSSREAIEMTRLLLRTEGVFCGVSSGYNIAAAVKISKRQPEIEGIVTMINDSGNRYLSTEVYGGKSHGKIPVRTHALDKYSES